MARFEFGEAFSSGFALIGRMPLTVFVWGLTYALIAMGPLVLIGVLNAGAFADFFNLASGNPAAFENQAMAPTGRFAGAINLMNAVQFLTSLAATGILFAAINRAVLEPQSKGFFYLRLGKEEAWQALVYLVLTILLTVILIFTGLLAAALGAGIFFGAKALAAPVSTIVQVVGIAACVIAALTVPVWVWLRLSLALPMTFAARTFQVFESWAVTRGQAWKLFGLGLLLMLSVLMIELVLFALIAVIAIGAGFSVGDWSGVADYFRQPSSVWGPTVTAIAVGYVLGVSVLIGGLYAILMAPWANVFKQLAPTATPSAADAFT